MAVNGNFFKAYNMIGSHRSFLLSRISLPMYQPVATLKQSLEESIGLPPKPKRPLTPYFTFNKQMRPVVLKNTPDLKMIEVTKVLAREWHKTPQEIKDKLKADYEAKLAEYMKNKQDYYNSFTDKQKAQLKAARIEEKIAKEKRLHAQALKNLGKPTKPKAAFYRWQATLGGKRGTMKLSDWQKSVGEKWVALPATEKKKYEQAATNDMEVYKYELKKWEEKMIELGNHDIIRYEVALEQKKRAKENKKPAQ